MENSLAFAIESIFNNKLGGIWKYNFNKTFRIKITLWDKYFQIYFILSSIFQVYLYKILPNSSFISVFIGRDFTKCVPQEKEHHETDWKYSMK